MMVFVMYCVVLGVLIASVAAAALKDMRVSIQK
jgi:hypothetical protein